MTWADAKAVADQRRGDRAAVRARINANAHGHDRRTIHGRHLLHKAAAIELEHRPVELVTLPLWKFFGWFTAGESVNTDLLQQAGITTATRRLGDLTDRQTNALADALRGHYADRQVAA